MGGPCPNPAHRATHGREPFLSQQQTAAQVRERVLRDERDPGAAVEFEAVQGPAAGETGVDLGGPAGADSESPMAESSGPESVSPVEVITGPSAGLVVALPASPLRAFSVGCGVGSGAAALLSCALSWWVFMGRPSGAGGAGVGVPG